MKNIRTILIVAIFMTAGSISLYSQTTYYVCDCQTDADADCIPGDDANNGTNPATPWKTFEQARSQFGSMQAGDQILFARGGSFEAPSGRWINYNSTGANPITIGDYTPSWASGNEERPLLINLSDGIFRFEDGGDADHDEGYILRNLILRGGENGWAIFLYNDVDYVTMDNLLIDGFSIGVHCAGSNPSNPGADGHNDHIILKNSTIVNCPGQGWLGGGNNITIEGNGFANNGFGQAIFNHNIYVSNSENVIIRDNDLYQSALIDGECKGVSLVVHGVMKNLIIENNYVHEDLNAAGGGCWGIAVDPGYGSAEDFRGTIISGNIVKNVGNTAIGVASCPDCIIENNVIIQEQTSFGTIGIAVPDRTRNSDDTPDSNVTVRNNTILFNNGSSGGTGIKVTTEGSSHAVVNNIVTYFGNSSGFSAFRITDLSPANFEIFNNNIAYYPNASGANWETNYESLNDWKTATGLDMQSQNTNPMFNSISTLNYDLIPVEGSPAINNGNQLFASQYDIRGLLRDSQPDIGAYEKNGIVEVSDPQELPLGFSLKQNYPNPFNPTTTIEYSIPVGANDYSPVRLIVFNLLGEEVATLVSKHQSAGEYKVSFDASGLNSGVYFYQLRAGNSFIQTNKMILLK